MAEILYRERRLVATPVYESAGARDRDYRPGGHEVIVGAITGLGVVDEERLTWEQVLEFRSDEQVRRDYRRLIHWLDKELVGKSELFVHDEIATRLERYETALRKHGIITVVGAIESVIDPKFVAGAGTLVAGIGLTTGSPAAGAITGAALAIGRVACSVARSLVDIVDARRGENAEVSYVHQVARRFGPQ